MGEVIGKENRYVLRLWCDGVDGDEWRATLRELNGEDSWKFSSIDELVRFLGTFRTSSTGYDRRDVDGHGNYLEGVDFLHEE